jgi:hypothetical protein
MGVSLTRHAAAAGVGRSHLALYPIAASHSGAAEAAAGGDALAEDDVRERQHLAPPRDLGLKLLNALGWRRCLRSTGRPDLKVCSINAFNFAFASPRGRTSGGGSVAAGKSLVSKATAVPSRDMSIGRFASASPWTRPTQAKER